MLELDYDKLIEFFDEYIAHFEELLEYEHYKMQIIAEHKVVELSQSLSKEQALMMKSNSLEKKRIEMLKAHNCENDKFTDTIAKAPDNKKARLTKQFNQLSKIITEIKRVNQNSMFMVNQNLSEIKKHTSPTTSETYTDKGYKKQTAGMSSTLMKNI